MKLLGKKTKFKRPQLKVGKSFLIKLYTILNDKKDKNNSKYIHWTKDGQSFIITNSNDFTKYVLPKFFNHQKFSSFVRQLNLYNFHKIKTGKKEEQKYTHNEFSKDKTIEQIKLIKKQVKSKDDDLSNQNIEILEPNIIEKISDKYSTKIEKLDELEKNEFQTLILNGDMSNITNQKKILSYLLDNSLRNENIQNNIKNEIKNLVQINNNLIEQIQKYNNILINQNENSKKMKVLVIFLVTLLLKKIKNNNKNNNNKNNSKNNKNQEKFIKFVDKYIAYKNNQKKNLKISIISNSSINTVYIDDSVIQKQDNFLINQDIFQDNIHNNANYIDYLNNSKFKSPDLDLKNSISRNNLACPKIFGDMSLRQSRDSRFIGNNIFNSFNNSLNKY